jgi:ABC-type lipoprotein release transport system permease subunit
VRACLLIIAFGCAIAATVLTAATELSPPSILVSRQLAEAEGLRVGQLVRLSTRADGRNPREFVIQDIFEPTADPARLGAVPRKVRMHLPDLLDLTRPAGVPAGSERLEGINIKLADAGDAAAFSKELSARMPGVLARPATEAACNASPFQVLERFHLAIASVTIAAATIFLVALTIMLVDERRATVGILRLIGLPAQRILFQLVLEGLLTATLGAVFGIILALASEQVINAFFQWKYDTALVFVRITPRVAAICCAIAVPLGAGATVAASWALLRRNGLALARR